MRKSWIPLVGLLGAAQVGGARADDFDIDNYRPASPGDAQLFGVQSAQQAEEGRVALGLSLGFADDQLILMDRSDRVAQVVDQRWVAHLGAAYRFGQVEASLGVPFILSQDGQAAPMAGATEADQGGVGDVRAAARVHFLRAGNLGLLGSFELSAPTGSRPEFGGDSTMSATPMLVAAWSGSGLTLAANVGARVRESQTVGDLEVGTSALVGAGLAYAPVPSVSFIGELTGEMAGSTERELPLEARGGMRYRHASGASFAGAYGRGLTGGYGAPDHRVIFSVGFRTESPPPVAPPAEIVEAAPVPPNPDPDRDGIVGDNDGCPEVPEDVDGFKDDDGCPEDDNDADGLADAADRCPTSPEDMDSYQDDDGCPEPDNDADGIADAGDACPNEAEIINGVEDDDGCPDAGEQLVVVGRERIEIKEMIYFANDRDEILPRSMPLIDQLAKTLERATTLRKIRVEGHTDERGTDGHNLDLSKRRAESVKAALVARGIDAARLEPKGYGESQPIDSNKSTRGRAKNRRVEFIIVDQDEPAALPGTAKGASK